MKYCGILILDNGADRTGKRRRIYGKQFCKDLLWNLVKCYEREEILNQRIAGIERMRNYINYVSQGHEKDCEKVREQMEKKNVNKKRQ